MCGEARVLDAEAARLDEAHLDAIEDRVDAELAGRPPPGIRSRSWTDSLPPISFLRERLWGQRVLALYRDGRQTEALQACVAIRRRLARPLGGRSRSGAPLLPETAVLEQRPDLDSASATEPGQPWLPQRSCADHMPTVHYAKAKDGCPR